MHGDSRVGFNGEQQSNLYVATTATQAHDGLIRSGFRSEGINSHVSAADGSNPGFSGYYATASWVLTGEHRPYDKNVGYARRVMPSRRIGAWEVFMRYGVVDLNDGAVHGGRMTGWWTGINWWATRRWKASIGYGTIDLDKGGTVGNTQTVLSRLQWIF